MCCLICPLRKLDIAFASVASGQFKSPVSTLYNLVSSLPRLKYLDIANTNLCKMPNEDDGLDRPPRRGLVFNDVYGLDGLDHELDFLSVFRCESITSSTTLPAKRVCSDTAEAHLLVGMEIYMDRVEVLHLVLNELYQHYRVNQQVSGSFLFCCDGLGVISVFSRM